MICPSPVTVAPLEQDPMDPISLALLIIAGMGLTEALVHHGTVRWDLLTMNDFRNLLLSTNTTDEAEALQNRAGYVPAFHHALAEPQVQQHLSSLHASQGQARNLVVALSGGKDSTAMALRLAELGVPFQVLYTPTGDELPEVQRHIERVIRACDAEMVDIGAPTLAQLIEEQQCLPNFRMRWCTRMIKIDPVQEYLTQHPGTVIAVGLRADEPKRVGGVYRDALVCFPLRDWGWTESDVLRYCAEQGMTPPPRTDCSVCFYQTLHEWWRLWKYYPEHYKQAEEWERQIGHTFRSPQRDTWPTALKDLRKEFEKGRIPKPRRRKISCRICAM